jgi:DNA-binding Lrp family transcriptional regulator
MLLQMFLKTKNDMRKNPETSLLAYERIMRPGAKETTYKKIINALMSIGTGNYEAIAKSCCTDESKVWKRLGEMRNMGLIIDTGLRVQTKNNNKSMVYALFTDKEKYKNIPKPERLPKNQATAVDYANLIIAKTSKKTIQPSSTGTIQNVLF